MRGLLTFVILSAALLPAQEAPATPAHLVITYRCPPPRRAAFRQYMTELGVQRFDRWKQDGVLKDYRFLFNSFVDVDTWDAMAILTFPNFGAIAKWREIEKTNPGGLARDAIDIAWPLNTYPVDLVSHEAAESPGDLSHAVYFITPYDSSSPGLFADYVKNVIGPQAKAYLRADLLAEYTLLTNRYPGGKRWQGLAILVFKDLGALSRRDEIKVPTANPPSANPARESILAESIGH